MKTPFDSQLADVFRGWNPGDLLLTPNLRLGRFLKDAYARLHSQIAFESLQAHALNSWLLQLWDQLDWSDTTRHLPAVLNPFQESLLWNEILEQDSNTPALINKQATAKQAQDAWRLLHEWKLDLQEAYTMARAAGDPFIFRSWCQSFKKKCQQIDCISHAELAELLIQQFTTLPKTLLPTKIWLYGFDEISPRIKDFFQQFQQTGIQVEAIECYIQQPQLARVEFTDEEAQLKNIADWAHRSLIDNPNQTIGIVIPTLTTERSRVERLFMERFEPQYIKLDQPQHATGFNITAGQELAQLPLVKTALRILECHQDSLPIDHYSHLLLSPFVGRLDESIWRAECDKALRELGELEIPFHSFKRIISEAHTREKTVRGNSDDIISNQDFDQPDFYQRNFYQHHFYQCITDYELIRKRDRHAILYPSEWIKIFNEQLLIWNWPGDRQLDTLEYQQWQTWQTAMEVFIGLDFFVQKISQSRAVVLFNQLLQQTPFHAETRRSPVQILGLLEAAGLPFDQLWIAGLDDQTWPGNAKPNSLLPIRMQVQYGLPQSSAEREYAYAQRLTQRLLTSSPCIYASHALQKSDQHFSPSRFIANWPTLPLQQSVLTNDYTKLIHQTQNDERIETLLDYCGPSLEDFDSVRGGTQILKSQAACPFQAFARYRLHTDEVASPMLGLDAMQRGNLVHAIMDIIWRQLRNQSQLLALSDEQLINLIQAAATESLKEIRHKKMAGANFTALEKQRLSELVLQWMQLEKQRDDFKVLLHESRKLIKLEKLPINIRYDRVDELADGSLLVLDYKTGDYSLQDWQGERPNEPQVPLYAIANKKNVSAAAFAILTTDRVTCRGIGATDEITPGIEAADDLQRVDLPNNWSSILQHWEKVLHQLSREFVAGSAAVDPKHPANTCRYCELQSLCRIHEQFDFDREIDNNEIPSEAPI